ncbi:hypothetical protein KI387_020822 [Taxus chinensis]|uniref:Transcription factor n=1 Tax=Taxus chinensis TaxID=29808 RepID=A0AA38LBR4_TAXCH|nr:hypothetical protein KI387_020822 [Taxus chinensis]
MSVLNTAVTSEAQDNGCSWAIGNEIASILTESDFCCMQHSSINEDCGINIDTMVGCFTPLSVIENEITDPKTLISDPLDDHSRSKDKLPDPLESLNKGSTKTVHCEKTNGVRRKCLKKSLNSYNKGAMEVLKAFGITQPSATKDGHRKVSTSRGVRDRRIRLSHETAVKFFSLQERLGFDQPSKALEWLIDKCMPEIDELPTNLSSGVLYGGKAHKTSRRRRSPSPRRRKGRRRRSLSWSPRRKRSRSRTPPPIFRCGDEHVEGRKRRGIGDLCNVGENILEDEYDCRSAASIPSKGSQDFDRLDEEQLMSMFADVEPFNKSQSNQSSNPPTHQASALDNRCSEKQATSENPSTPSDHNSINEPSMEEKLMTVSGQFKSELEVQSVNKSDQPLQTAKTEMPSSSAMELNPNMDPKQVKQILANRQSAQRSRVRKLQYISEVERSVNALHTEVSTLSPQVTFLDHE